MADSNDNNDSLLPPDSATLSPLPDVLHSGLACVAAFACLSFAACTLTLFYLTNKLVRWHIKSYRARRQAVTMSGRHPVDLQLGLEEQHFGSNGISGNAQSSAPSGRRAPNQFLVLIFNLLLADIHQSMAFLINAVWVSNDAILVGTTTCWAQGWFVSTGDLASSLFILLIAIHTYMTVVWKYKPPQWSVYTAVAFAWAFDYAMALIGIGITDNGRSKGGFYVRAAAWCWVNIGFENLRLVTHYLFIFLALVLTTVLYTLIFFSLKRQEVRETTREALPPAKSTSSVDGRRASLGAQTVRPTTTSARPHVDAHSGGRHPAFLLYPLIYVVCTAPLALGRIATMAGAKVPLSYFCVAGALIASNGWLDVLLWSWTRGELLFTANVDSDDLSPGTFAFMRTPVERQYGNMVWVEGGGEGATAQDGTGAGAGRRDASRSGGIGGWLQERMGWQRIGRAGGPVIPLRRGRAGQGRSVSQESLRGNARRNDMAIQMDLVTTVTVEVDTHKKASGTSQYRQPSITSLSSMEKDNLSRRG